MQTPSLPTASLPTASRPTDTVVASPAAVEQVPTVFEVRFTSGDVVLLEGADAYQPEGAFTTFFASGSSRSTIDSWSTRIASYRATDIVSVQRSSSGARVDGGLFEMLDLRTRTDALFDTMTADGESVSALAA